MARDSTKTAEVSAPTLFYEKRAVRRGDYKLIEDGGLRLLFNVRVDPGERDDLTMRDPARVKAMRELLTAWERDVDDEAKNLGAKSP